MIPALNDASPLDLAFPEEVISGAAGEFAEMFATRLESPKQFWFMSYLTCLGLLISGKISIRSELDFQPRLFTILLGESGDDRKSTAMKKTVEFFQKALVESERFSICTSAGSAEGLHKLLMKAKDENCRTMLLCLDEFRHFTGKANIRSSALLPCVGSLFESNSDEVAVKDAANKLENIHLAILAASTKDTYQNTSSPASKDIGFNNRLWLVPGGTVPRFSIPEKMPDMDYDRLKDHLVQIQRFVRDHKEVAFSPSAFAIYDHWYMTRERGVYSKRLDTYATRLMLLLAVNAMKPEIGEEEVRTAITLCNHQLHVRRANDPIDAETKMATMEAKIRRVLIRRPIQLWELKQLTHYKRMGLNIFTPALENLMKAKDVGLDRTGKIYSWIGRRDD